MNSPRGRISFTRAAFFIGRFKNSCAACRFNARCHFDNYVSFIGLYARNSFSTVRQYPRVHKPSQSSDWARSSQSKNPFLHITRGHAVGSTAAENHEKKGWIDRRNRYVHYALLYGRALLSVRSFSWFPVDWGSLSTNARVDGGLRAAYRWRKSDGRPAEMRRQREKWRRKQEIRNEKGRRTEMRKRVRLEMVIMKKGNELFPSTPRRMCASTYVRRHARTHARGMRSRVRVACACVRVTFHRGTPNGWFTAVKGMRVWLCA